MLKGQASVIRKINSFKTPRSLRMQKHQMWILAFYWAVYQNVLLSQDIVLKSESTLSIPTMELKY